MALGDPYVTLDEVIAHAEIKTSEHNAEVNVVRSAVSRLVESFCGRQFNDAGSATARVFWPSSTCSVDVDEFHTTTGLVVETDSGNDGNYSTALTDYTLYPLNGVRAGRTGWPYNRVEVFGSDRLTVGTYRPGVRVTARWGWASVPADVKHACLLECTRVFRRKYTPDGLLAETSAGVAGYAVRVPTELDRTSQALLAPFRRIAVA